MKFCSKCGKEVNDEAVICMNCGCAIENRQVAVVAEDKVSAGLCVLAVLVPLFGIIYWPVKHKETPKKAKACGIAGIISWAVSFVIYLVFYMLILGEYYW